MAVLPTSTQHPMMYVPAPWFHPGNGRVPQLSAWACRSLCGRIILVVGPDPDDLGKSYVVLGALLGCNHYIPQLNTASQAAHAFPVVYPMPDVEGSHNYLYGCEG